MLQLSHFSLFFLLVKQNNPLEIKSNASPLNTFDWLN